MYLDQVPFDCQITKMIDLVITNNRTLLSSCGKFFRSLPTWINRATLRGLTSSFWTDQQKKVIVILIFEHASVQEELLYKIDLPRFFFHKASVFESYFSHIDYISHFNLFWLLSITIFVSRLTPMILFASHTAAIAAGNNGIPVRMHGFEFGRASGMAPRAR